MGRSNEFGTLVISDAKFLESLPLDRGIFYRNVLGAIADEATELRFEPGGVGGRIWCKVAGVDYELAETPREVAELELLSSIPHLNKQLRDLRVEFVISGEKTEVLASFEHSKLVLQFVNPCTASQMASTLLSESLKLSRERG